MATIKEIQEKYFTEKGLETLKSKLKTSIRFYNDEETKPVTFPFCHMMFGFEKWQVNSKEELKCRIKELAQIIGGVQIKEETEIIKNSDGEVKMVKLRCSS